MENPLESLGILQVFSHTLMCDIAAAVLTLFIYFPAQMTRICHLGTVANGMLGPPPAHPF